MASSSVGVSQSQNQSSSQSTSSPAAIQTPQSEWSLALSKALADLGNQRLNWANNEYGKTSGITDANINNYMATGQAGMGLAANEIGNYEQIYAPEENKYLQEANSYASPERQAFEMGAAEADTGMASDKALANTRQQLESYGIDPSSGRYADLLQTGNLQKAAAQAGAAQVARRATEATGQQMQLNAINVGLQKPGAAVNALNSTQQSIAGSENAGLANANTGVNLYGSANAPFQTATNITGPVTGQNSQSSSQSTGSSVGVNTSSSTDGSGAGKQQQQPGGGGNGPSGYDPNYNSGSGMGGGSAPSPGVVNAPGGGMLPADAGLGGYDPNSSTYGEYPGDPNADTGPYLSGSGYDPYGGYGGTDTGGYGEFQGDPNADTSGYFSGDFGGGSDYSGGGDYGTFFAEGGDVPPDQGDQHGVLPPGSTTGGHVPMEASPSMGQMTDDVPARLNAGEFVIPKDVAAWKGQEFFQKLIEQSRARRTGAPAAGKKKPALPNMHQPTFTSRPMGGQQ